jgi:hypothetical protein
MASPIIKLKRSAVAGKRPTLANLPLGEIALNTYDGKLFVRQDTSGVGIATTVRTINPWSENFVSGGEHSIYYDGGDVGIGTDDITEKLHIVGNVRSTGVITATSFYGDGSNLTGITADAAVGVQTSGGYVGSGVTAFSFEGTAVGNVTVPSSGISTININATTALSRTVTNVTPTQDQTDFTVSYQVGFIDVYLNGVLLSGSDFTATNGTLVSISTSLSTTDNVDFIAYEGINAGVVDGINRWTSVGSSIYNNNSGNVGIGTDKPVAKLQVQGTIRATTNVDVPSGDIYCGGDAANGSESGIRMRSAGFIHASRSSGFIWKGYTTGTSDPTSQIGFDGDAHFLGNIGIGTDNPDDDRLRITGGGLTIKNDDLLGYVNLETSKEVVFGPFTNYLKARGGSTPAIVQNEDNIGNLHFKAHDGIQYERAARIEAYVDGTPGANDMPGRLEFHTRASGATGTSERLRITSAGLVGIGTDDPDGPLHVLDDTNDTNVKIEATASGKDARLELIANSTGVSQIRLGDEASANPGSITYDHSGNSLSFRTNGTSDRLRITSAGLVGIGTDDPEEALDVNGNVKAVDFNSTSDIKLKDKVRKISKSLSKLDKIRGVSFEWKETKQKSMGVVAQEVEKVLPDLVRGDETKTVNYNGLIGLLIECVKEQQIKIDQLEQKLSQL